MLSKIDLLNLIKKYAKEYREDCVNSVRKNKHMHELKVDPKDIEDFEIVVDTILVDFINFVGMKQGVDYALYTVDLK